MRPASSTAAVAALFAVVATSSRGAVAFAPAAASSSKQAQHVTNAAAPITSKLFSAAEDTETAGDAAAVADTTGSIQMPLSFEEMIKLASSAVSDAYEQGITRQSVRVLLPRDASSGDLGVQYENDAIVDGRNEENVVLVPPDETWQGGSPQLYRACAPTAQEILRRVSKDVGGVPPRMVEDRSIDESGVDGIGLWMSQSQNPADDISCFVQPSQETIGAIEGISGQAGDRLVMLMNPQWRNVDDALDAASKKGGILGGFASFLGGKGASLQKLEELGFKDTLSIEGYVCRGGNIRFVRRFDSDYVVFAENDAGTAYIKVGTSKMRPTYQDIDQMLEDNGIALKYARDVGLADKLE
mmetsp:Transcript_2369/g.6877  ORF Transcript_2369/g.6877 Transcript_2369/m.6877 type:complete len:356 (-) Transcript_2369:113-1180(-)|eukprot:CAMPEP_0181050898 /NCGR_PEP_ID=MMETSP1070-20121207/16763_1 /TAXON_ID=265543 /ORGANISM="Minutocellus polymorphus, Strain NH13" /LENGTH=355 /DNA_ID=CAMNT_0023129877 /DNA_START=53 /DNA_END=1120 /DNA_ORIENTATION=+